MSFESQFAVIQAEERAKANHFLAVELRKFLAGALCCHCGEELGTDEEIISDDEDRTIHARCEEKDSE